MSERLEDPLQGETPDPLLAPMLLMLYLTKGRRSIGSNGANFPLGLWVAQFAGSPFGRAAFQAATIDRAIRREIERNADPV